MQSFSEEFAEFSSRTAFDDIPAETIRNLSLHVLDTIGVALACARLPYAQMIADLVIEDGGIPESTLIGLGHQLPADSAAFYNGALTHGQSYDDTHLVALVHPTGAVLPAALAVGEANAASGATVLRAVALGAELMCRLGIAAGPALLARGLHPSAICGTFGATMAACLTAGADAETMVTALGIAGGMTAGVHESTLDGSWNKRIHSGLAARAGVNALSLAQSGITAPKTIFEGNKGLFRSFAGMDSVPATVMAGLGESWQVDEMAVKVYPCCQGGHAYIDCALELLDTVGFDASAIDKIDIVVGKRVGLTLCEPRDMKVKPPNALAGKFSLPYLLGAAFARGSVDDQSFVAETLADSRIQDLASRVTHHVDAGYDDGMALRGAVQVTLADGRVFAQETAACKGTRDNPLSTGEVVRKFRATSGAMLSDGGADQLISMVMQLSTVADVRSMATVLRPVDDADATAVAR
jgi:2-methylcitrate dehydratase PrpD